MIFQRNLLILLFIYLSLFVTPICLAQADQGRTSADQGGTVCVPNPLNPDTDACSSDNNPNYTDPRVIIGNGIKTILGIVGSVALAVFIYGGVLWLTSGGNETRIKKGKDVILWATLGLVIIFAAYAIVGFFLGGGFLSIFFI